MANISEIITAKHTLSFGTLIMDVFIVSSASFAFQTATTKLFPSFSNMLGGFGLIKHAQGVSPAQSPVPYNLQSYDVTTNTATMFRDATGNIYDGAVSGIFILIGF